MDALILRDKAKEQLAEIKSLETGVAYLSKMKTLETWVSAEKKDAELQNIVAEQKIRTQRILGKLIREQQASGQLATRQTANPKGTNQHGGQVNTTDMSKPKTLADVGLTRNESSDFQKIAAIPEKKFEQFIAEKKQIVDSAVKELTTSGILAFAKTGNVHVSNNSGENEWYTPKDIIESARSVLGSIDLDPASCEEANNIVKAKRFYSISDDGLSKKWTGKIWLNPPYSQPEIKHFSEKLIIEKQNIIAACVLVNNATETAWAQLLLSECTAVCFLSSRVKFINKEGISIGAPLQGQMVLYFGSNKKLFTSTFVKHGIIKW
jgi:hypothetical protein